MRRALLLWVWLFASLASAWAGGGCPESRQRTCYAGPAGSLGQGICSSGVQICLNGVWGPCTDAVEPIEELCNGLDDDCDGQADEALPLNACGRCGALPDERCDGIDNDCNGEVDAPDCPVCEEGTQQICYSGPDGTVGVGLCSRGLSDCVDGRWTACVGERPPAPEQCDGLDDDCDGATDEGARCPECVDGRQQICFDGPLGAVGQGICSSGLRTCVDGTWAACEGQRLPEAERCNGVDEDCDGGADESLADCGRCAAGAERPCYSGPEGSAGFGVCKAGLQGCVAGRWTECVGDRQPIVETCNGVDDDCDGQADEGLEFNACGGCGPAPEETCDDGGDEDCDGLVDEGCEGACEGESRCYPGPDGTAGVGLCVAGMRGCEDGMDACPGAVSPIAETCDGRDEDCDGAVDEGLSCQGECAPGADRSCYDGPGGSVSVGRCREGLQTCQADGAWGACVGQVLPELEICDAIDQDCDGQIDEDESGRALSLCCEDAERCNGIDDDCDGVADEGFAGLGDVCLFGETCQRSGRFICDPSGDDTVLCVVDEAPTCIDFCPVGARCDAACSGCVSTQVERCNGLDDDDDGVTDEGFGDLGAACVADPEAGCQRAGLWVCGPDGESTVCLERVRGDVCVDRCEVGAQCDADCGRCVPSQCAARASCGGDCTVGGEAGRCRQSTTDGSCICRANPPVICAPPMGAGLCGGACMVADRAGNCEASDGACVCRVAALVDGGVAPSRLRVQGSRFGQGCDCETTPGRDAPVWLLVVSLFGLVRTRRRRS